MANVKFTDLNPNDRAPTLAGTDILAVTTDPSGSPVSKATTITNLMGQAPVQSVNTAIGAVVLDADDIDDSSTTNKFVTQSDIINLGNLSGTNSGDQDLSSYLQSTDSINALSDVDTSTSAPTDGQALVWVNNNSKWEPGTVSGGGGGATVNSGTAANLPSSPSTADIYLETDTGKLRWWDGTYWNTFNYDTQLDPNYAANQLGYSGGLFSSTNYQISTQPIMHFDAAILDGSDQANNPSAGSAVGTWGDRSGQAINYDATQATGSAQPTFNVSGNDKYVIFDGGDSLDFTDYNLPTAFNIVMVANTSADADTLLPIGTSVNSAYIFLEYSGTTYGISGSVTDNTYGPHYNSIQQFWSTRDGSNNHNIYVQGGNSIISANASLSRTVARIGKANNTIWHTGAIYEIIIWGADLSTTDKNTVNSYLQNKYSSLPTLTAFS